MKEIFYYRKTIFIAKPVFEGRGMKKELELSEKIERRLEMIYAHTKLGKTIQEVIKEFCVCLDTYYYWYHRYVEPGIFGLFDSKRGPRHHITKSAMMLHPRSVEIADRHPELDAREILEVLNSSSGHKPSVPVFR